MRWDELFEDLSARADQWRRDEEAEEVADRRSRDEATVAWTDRVRATTGEVALLLADGGWTRGQVLAAGPGWILLRDGESGGQVLVPQTAVVAVRGASRHSAAPLPPVAARRTLVLAVRALAREEVRVQVRTRGLELTGRLDRVGADHVDVVVEGSAEVVTVPFAALLRVAERS